jgi:predicted amidophosphoribosyltransferase
MGDQACYRDYCPSCDRALLKTDEECPECGEPIPHHRQ